jgi:capsular exopolysaccharide synthesis family protein
MMKDVNQPVGHALDAKATAGDAGLVTPHDIKRFMKRYRGTILTCFLVGVLAAAAYSYSATPMYTARTQIIIDPSLPQVLRDPTSDTTFTIDNSQVESQLEVLRSEKIAIAVIDQMKLQDEPEFTGPESTLHWLAGNRPESPDAAQRMALGRYQSNLYVRRVGVSYAIEILYRSKSPELAAKIANATADAYIQEQFSARAQAAQRSNAWLEQRIDQLRTQMNDAALSAQEFRAKRDYRITPSKDAASPSDTGAVETPQKAAARRNNTIEELDTTAQTYRRIYESYLRAYAESVQKQSYPITNARVITSASPLIGKSHPKTKLILALGGFAGAFVGFGIAFFRQSIDHSVSSARQIREEIGVECLASVPLLAMRPAAGLTSRLRTSRVAQFCKRVLDRRPAVLASCVRLVTTINSRAGLMLQGHLAQRAMADAATGDCIVPDDAETMNTAVALPFSGFSHGMKTWKTAIALAGRARPIRSIAVTSALPNEGKSTLTANLAALYDAAGTRVLLVDGDLRTGRLSQILAPTVTRGLVEAIEGDYELQECVVPVNNGSLHLLPVSTGATAHSDEVLGSPKAQALLKQMQKDYDLVIIELPPLAASVDSLAISAMIDCTVVVAEWGMTPVPVLSEAVHLLRSARAKILGIVLNKVDTSTVRYGDAAGDYLSHWSPVTMPMRRRA